MNNLWNLFFFGSGTTGFYKIVELLLKAGANVNIAEENTRNSPLHSAAAVGDSYEHYLIVNLLINNDAFVNSANSINNTPLHEIVSSKAIYDPDQRYQIAGKLKYCSEKSFGF